MKVLIGFFIALISYAIIGSSSNIDELKKLVPEDIPSRNWEIVRYEGYEWGSFNKHGGTVHYHVKDKQFDNVYYRISVALWNNELQYYYGEPEGLNRVDVQVKNNLTTD